MVLEKFAKTHEWVKVDAGVGTIGITAHAANELGEIVYVDLPKVGAKYKAKSAFGAIESVKAASDVYTPISGEVVEVNTALVNAPGTVNSSPLGEGWMIKVRLDNVAELNNLMDSAAYEAFAGSDKH
jgi:glycine cleavage system H protein